MQKSTPQPVVDVRAIRRKMNLTQGDFAARFHLRLEDVRAWESGSRPLLKYQKLLFLLIQNHANVVEEVAATLNSSVIELRPKRTKPNLRLVE